MGGQVSQLFSYRFTFVITRRVAARRMSKINGSHLELFPRTFAFFPLALPPTLTSRLPLPLFFSLSFSLFFFSLFFSYLVIVILLGFIINVNIPRPSRQSQGADANFYQIIRTQCTLYFNARRFTKRNGS